MVGLIIRKKYTLALVIVFVFFLQIFVSKSLAQTTTPEPTATSSENQTESQENTDELRSKIADLQGKVNSLHAQSQSLTSQINVMDNQIELTELRIKSTQQEIVELEKDIEIADSKVDDLESSLEDLSKVLLNRVVATYQIGSIEPIQVLLTSNGVGNFLQRANYLRVVQAHDKQLMYDTQQAKIDYKNQKDIYAAKKVKVENLKEQLDDYTVELDSSKKQKEVLLSETQGSEANYQRLLSQARAQLESFSQFAISQGGASILSNQTVCDDWGCYYNQRDSQWGGISLNGTGYTLASDGCLVTSMAMVYTHYGYRDVTPLTINGIPSNFASYYPAWLKFSISASGASFSRSLIGQGEMDQELSAGRPVVVGISYDGGSIPDHFIVIISGSNGSYRMNDPFTPNGHDIPLESKYPVSSIIARYKVNT